MNLRIVEFGVEYGEHVVLSEDLDVGLAELLQYFLGPRGGIGLSDQCHQLEIIVLHIGIFQGV